MNKKKEISKSQIFYLVILILSLMIMISSITIAYFSMVASQENDDTKLYTGSLIINFIDGKVINNPTLIPRYEPTSISDVNNVYVNEFEVESTGTLDQNIDIYMEVISNEFTNNTIKYKLFDNDGNEVSTGYVNGTGNIKIANSKYLEHEKKQKYTVMFWIQENEEDQNAEKGKNLKITLNVEAIQTMDLEFLV